MKQTALLSFFLVTAATSAVSDAINWNVKDPDATTNGNIQLAVKYMKSSTTTAPTKNLSDAAVILKTPWKYYGQTHCFNGTVAVVEDQPPGSDVSKLLGGGETSEVVIQTPDESLVDFFAMGSSGTLRIGDTTTVCGLPVGRMEVPNAVGASSRLIVVGVMR